ncbi:hypothetical protein UUU_21670 [Klebsiella pneumoniae subsp. pneumoniae DSM 30104 = JCM 1662 = NBRC 14940]|nr:hypothetical protein UUU_21670 [Klebsiella pneumoniae subsp. pneumoniae DSM 30104 = JCM 1662 = NBRC 14940]
MIKQAIPVQNSIHNSIIAAPKREMIEVINTGRCNSKKSTNSRDRVTLAAIVE